MDVTDEMVRRVCAVLDLAYSLDNYDKVRPALEAALTPPSPPPEIPVSDAPDRAGERRRRYERRMWVMYDGACFDCGKSRPVPKRRKDDAA